MKIGSNLICVHKKMAKHGRVQLNYKSNSNQRKLQGPEWQKMKNLKNLQYILNNQ